MASGSNPAAANLSTVGVEEVTKQWGWFLALGILLIVGGSVEHIEAVANIDDILSVAGIDAFFVGPTDLGASLAYDKGEVEQAIHKIIDAGKEHGACIGIHQMPLPTPAEEDSPGSLEGLHERLGVRLRTIRPRRPHSGHRQPFLWGFTVTST